MNLSQMSHINEKAIFYQSLDDRIYVKMSLDKKGYVTRPFQLF